MKPDKVSPIFHIPFWLGTAVILTVWFQGLAPSTERIAVGIVAFFAWFFFARRVQKVVHSKVESTTEEAHLISIAVDVFFIVIYFLAYKFSVSDWNTILCSAIVALLSFVLVLDINDWILWRQNRTCDSRPIKQ